jgi:murein DD-endopeptidase MepM/ murein hydrolase activator NlpD
VFCGLALVSQVSAQEVAIAREGAKAPKADTAAIKEALDELRPQKAVAAQPAKATTVETKPGPGKPPAMAQVAVQKTVPAPQTVKVPETKPLVSKSAATAQVAAQKSAPASQAPSIEISAAKTTPPVSAEVKPAKPEVAHPAQAVAVSSAVPKSAVPAPAPSTAPRKPAAAIVVATAPNKPATPPVVVPPVTKPATSAIVSSAPGKPTAVTVGSAPSKLNHDADRFPDAPANLHGATAFTKLAGGFDFPIGKPDAQGYYKARGFQTRGHLGEDWDGTGGGDTDMGDPVFVIGDGVVVFARDCHQGWGNVIIVRHAYREGGSVRNIDSLYAHCQKILVKKGQAVTRGQQIAAIGNAHGLYDAHLHFEIRKNLAIGMSRDKFAKDLSNYCDPTQFIAGHRHLQSTGGNWRIAMNTFTYDEKIKWDKLRNYSHARTGGGSSQSARNLKKALAAPNVGAHTN